MVVLVDENDNEIGKMEKMEAHRKALLHRAVSVFIFNSKGEFLLQQRARNKYHSALLWTNTACTHPYLGETNLQAAKRRLKEEMGLEAELKEIFSFIYKEPLDNELTEHELDYVFVGFTDVLPNFDTDEVNSYAYKSYKQITTDLQNNRQNYTVWFEKIFEKVFLHANS